MNNINWEFFEEYKSLDELCKQILSSDRGISEYIDEMCNVHQGSMMVANWEKDYKQLKKMRWIRNQLAHEVNSAENELVTEEDIDWLRNFRMRIIECTDPFSMLHKYHNESSRLSIKTELQPEYNKSQKELKSECYQITKESSRNLNAGIENIMLIGIAVLIAVVILGAIFCVFLLYK